MTFFRVEFASNAAPIFSDHSHRNIEAETAMQALRTGIAEYEHPCGLFAAIAQDSKGKTRARYLSARAATANSAPCGMLEWRGDQLFCSDKLVPPQPELWQEIPERSPVAT